MSNTVKRVALAAALTLAGAAAPARAADLSPPKMEVGYLTADQDITLRRMVVRNPTSKQTVLLLHGFPETLYAWKDISLALGDEFEVHAFDWPGFGLSSRPPADRFAYAPKDYARVLRAYIANAGIDRSRLTIYATDIGALPALLLALDEPDIARTIIVGDFAPFDRPAHMYANLQALKAKPSSDVVRAQMNLNREEILENAYRRGLPRDRQFEVSPEYKDDMARGWGAGGMSTADAFYHYYASFTRDQQYFEANLSKLRTPVKVVWGADDLYINKAMGAEFAARAGAEFTVLPGVGHYPHLQVPKRTVEEIRAAAR
ncbi:MULTISPECIES: alpha/beta fold hydrolase [unclassified Phenylobacterium]|uniref:alpha/beta fold hydrolase n=1 Tax=unclassified Phenylobacterium TaxID=2640670 RepID=UPI00083B0C36|nr:MULTISPECIES: alpha/beta hydrolase [unclassified Phenylobacterium]